MYDLNAYGRMMADSVRMKAYTTALREAINPHSVVLEIGTGAGIFALLACQYGAKRVYAIEPSDVISVARAAAVANGYADRIIFLQDYSTNIMLPERADIILSDLRGTLPYFHTNVTSLIDARQRFLAPGGRLIPQDDSLQVGVVSAPELYRHYTAPWDEHGQKLDWQVARRAVLNTSHLGRVKPEQILMSAQCGSALDYTSVVNPNFKGKVSWTA
ncbi:MAG TPA: class I SAM-dependent methyltransferase, partial [Blastocatellia bacterium]|nr:class I SAM-dependent methyltransferase [Blastocatellia bacterium]